MRGRAIRGVAALSFAVAAILPTPRTASAAVPNAYVALGDSFTAGPLIPAPTGEPIDCGQSTSNYPRLVAAALQAPVFRDASCGSAQTEDMTQPQDDLPFDGTNPPQFDRLGADVAIVTVGIGGNDIGFGAIVDRCVQPPSPVGEPCTPYFKRDGGDELSENIQEAAPKVGAVFRGIHERAPNAVVFALGYPALLPHEGNGCYPYVPVLPEDVPYLREKQEELNAMVAAQAAANDAMYVDWYTPSRGHDACQVPTVAWVNGAVVVPPSYPAHPNADGMIGAADAAMAAIRASGFEWPTQEASTATSAPDRSAVEAVEVSLPATGAETSLPIGVGLAGAAMGLRSFTHRRGTTKDEGP